MSEKKRAAADMLPIESLRGRVGVYGFANSYVEAGTKKSDKIPPYYFRGELSDLVSSNNDLPVLDDCDGLSEEFELVFVIDRRDKKNSFIGYTFGNDLTNLSEFREDKTRILHAKSPKAAIYKQWWPSDVPPKKIEITVYRHRSNSVNHNYSAILGSDCLSITTEDAVNSVARMVGADNYNTILLFTGAPRGFAWQDSPARIDDTFEMAAAGYDLAFTNTLVNL